MTTQAAHTRFPDADERLTRILYAASVNRESAAELLQGMLDGAKLDAVDDAHDDLVSALVDAPEMDCWPDMNPDELRKSVEGYVQWFHGLREAALKKAGAQ